MISDLIKKLLDAGVHFGHQTRRWNPKMKKFIFGERAGIYIIDLEKTADCIEKAQAFARDIASKGGKFLFVGTKKQAQEVMREEAQRVGMYYINSRWMGGLLTNFETVKKSIRKLQDIERMEKDGTFSKLTKKEVSLLNKEKERLLIDLGGIREMTKQPDAIFIVDVKKEDIAIKEAVRLNIPVIAMIDTNSDPDFVNMPIPSNDDAVKAIRLVTGLISDAIKDGIKVFSGTEKIQKQETTASTEETVPSEIATALVPEELEVYEAEVPVKGTVDTKKPKKISERV